MTVDAGKRHVALVTGASRGLGRALAVRLAAAGADLALLARDEAALAGAAEEARAAATMAGQVIRCYPADLADKAAVEAVATACRVDFGRVDVLINNAAVLGPVGRFEEIDVTAWQAVFAVNLFAPAHLSRCLVPGMLQRGFGRIVNLSGGGATSPRPAFSAYASSKCALVRFSETLAEELRGSGVTVNCVAPGAMPTAMLREVLATGQQGSGADPAKAALEEGGEAVARAADLVAFLASDAAGEITGRLVSAVWDDWRALPARATALASTDVYTLRRIVPKDRGLSW
jgi:NAD(P)-dependent dehydrogenase (short-subunit alcohol dehydrogenase family)